MQIAAGPSLHPLMLAGIAGCHGFSRAWLSITMSRVLCYMNPGNSMTSPGNKEKPGANRTFPHMKTCLVRQPHPGREVFLFSLNNWELWWARQCSDSQWLFTGSWNSCSLVFLTQSFHCQQNMILFAWTSTFSIFTLLLCVLCSVWFFETPQPVPCQDPLSTEFSRQAYWSGLPFPHAGDLPDPGNEPVSVASSALSGCATWEAHLLL